MDIREFTVKGPSRDIKVTIFDHSAMVEPVTSDPEALALGIDKVVQETGRAITAIELLRRGIGPTVAVFALAPRQG